MRRVVLSLALVAGLAAAVPAAANDEAAPPAPTEPAKPTKPAKPAKDDPNRIVCTREHVVGSNRPQKVCLTVAERQRLKDSASRTMDEGRRPGQQNPGQMAGE